MNSFYLLVLFSIFLHCNCVILETKQGILKGEILASRNGRLYHAFYSIPYAEPPLGELRFQNPVQAKSWQGVREAVVPGPPCMSLEKDTVVGKEDCLYLNVYTPKIGENIRLPVIVYIHGGGFRAGHALPSRYGPQYFMDEDVVLITFNYRVDIFGFLSTADEVIPGNYGMKDAIAVLKWVQEYIDAYGGDKNRVTLAGDSSGGITASYTLISPLAKGLVHRVISQDAIMIDIQTHQTAMQTAWKYASIVGCNNEKVNTSEVLLKCLKELPAEKLYKNSSQLSYFGFLNPTPVFGPVVENEKVTEAFLVDEPRKLFRGKTNIPWILGFNSQDGGGPAIAIYCSNGGSVIDEMAKNYKKYFPILLRYKNKAENSEQLDQLTEIYRNHYFGNTDIRENIHGFSKMITCMLQLPQRKEIIREYSAPFYFYYYDHRNEETFARTCAKYNEDMGVVHGDELISMFNWSEKITPVTKGVDLVVSKQMVKLWANFAAKGDPNDDGEDLWKPVNSSDINYLHIKNGRLEMKDALLKSEYEFLESVSVKGHSQGLKPDSIVVIVLISVLINGYLH